MINRFYVQKCPKCKKEVPLLKEGVCYECFFKYQNFELERKMFYKNQMNKEMKVLLVSFKVLLASFTILLIFLIWFIIF